MPRGLRSWRDSSLDLVHDGEGVADGFHADRPTHDGADIQRFRDLGVRRAQVEDLLHAVLDSVEAVLDDRDGEGRQLLVLLAQRAVGEHALADLADRGRHLHGALGDQAVEPLPLLVLLVQVDHAPSLASFGGPSFGGGPASGGDSSVRIRARASASPRRASSRCTMQCWTRFASCAVGSVIHALAHSRLSALSPSVGDSCSSRSRRSSAGSPAARSRPAWGPVPARAAPRGVRGARLRARAAIQPGVREAARRLPCQDPEGETGSWTIASSLACPGGTRNADASAARATTNPTTKTLPTACAIAGRIRSRTSAPRAARVTGLTSRSGCATTSRSRLCRSGGAVASRHESSG